MPSDFQDEKLIACVSLLEALICCAKCNNSAAMEGLLTERIAICVLLKSIREWLKSQLTTFDSLKHKTLSTGFQQSFHGCPRRSCGWCCNVVECTMHSAWDWLVTSLLATSPSCCSTWLQLTSSFSVLAHLELACLELAHLELLHAWDNPWDLDCNRLAWHQKS